MRTAEELETATVSLRMEPGESMSTFAARVAQAHGPLDQTEIARLRKVLAPAPLPDRIPPRPVPVKRRPAAWSNADDEAAAPLTTGTAA